MDDDTVDSDLLEDAARLLAADRQGLLRALATAGAQVRELDALGAEAGVDRLAAGGPPRSLVLISDPRAADTVELLTALADRRDGCPVVAVPLEPSATGVPALPNWVGAADLVVITGLSRSRESELAMLADAAARRGAALLGVGRAGGSLAERCSWARAPYVAVPLQRTDGDASWALATPVLRLAGGLGLLGPGDDTLDGLAAALDRMAALCRPDAESFVNPGKLLALQLAGALPVLLADSTGMGMVARRFASALARLAGVPAAVAVLPGDAAEAAAYLTGPFAPPSPAPQDIFRDRVEDSGPTLRLVVVREQPPPEGLAPSVLRELVRQAELTGLGPAEMVAEESGRLPRMGALIALGDFAASYLRLASGRGDTDLGRYRA